MLGRVRFGLLLVQLEVAVYDRWHGATVAPPTVPRRCAERPQPGLRWLLPRVDRSDPSPCRARHAFPHADPCCPFAVHRGTLARNELDARETPRGCFSRCLSLDAVRLGSGW